MYGYYRYTLNSNLIVFFTEEKVGVTIIDANGNYRMNNGLYERNWKTKEFWTPIVSLPIHNDIGI